MPTAIQDREAIYSAAIALGSPEEREAYIAHACGNDAVLRRQIEERVAAHFQSRQGAELKANGTSNGAGTSKPSHEHSGTPAPHAHKAAAPSHPAETHERTKSGRGMVTTVIVLAALSVGIGLAVWGLRTKSEAQLASQEAAEARERALQAEEQFKHQSAQVEAARLTAGKERDEAVTDEKAAKEAVEDMKAALSFFQGRVLAAGRPSGWTGGQGKDVTLRKAVDAAESRVAEAFPDRPLAEAAIRETLGSTYLDLTEPALAVKEFERALALREALQGEQNPDALACRNQLAVAYRLANRPDEASRLYDSDDQSSTHASALAVRAGIMLAQKRPVEAEAKLRECLAIRGKLHLDDWSTYDAKAMLGQALMQQKKYDEAEQLLLSGCEGMKQREAKIPASEKVHYLKAIEHLVQYYDAEKQKPKADQWRKELKRIKSETKS